MLASSRSSLGRCVLGSVGLAALLGGCATSGASRLAPAARESVAIVSPRCAGVRACVLGHVTEAGSATPVAEAAVFLELEPADGEPSDGPPVRILALTDAQGVFEIDDPPPGSYRLAVYKDDSSVEVAGIELGRPGTTMLPVRLAAQ